MSILPKLMEVNPLFFNFYNSAYPNCTFKISHFGHLLTVTLLNSARIYRIDNDMSIKY